jgi:hypothetical protein
MKKPDLNHPFFKAYPIKGLVTFNFRREAINELESFAAGYHRAAKTLATKMRRSVHPLHYDGFPMLFLYRHALELYLKAVIYLGAQLIRVRGGPEIALDGLLKEHRLGYCLPPLEKVLKELDWLEGFKTRGIRNFQEFVKLVEKIDHIDAGSYSFRYPIDTKGRRALPDRFFMNALGFAKLLDPVLAFLDIVIFALNTELDL